MELFISKTVIQTEAAVSRETSTWNKDNKDGYKMATCLPLVRMKKEKNFKQKCQMLKFTRFCNF